MYKGKKINISYINPSCLSPVAYNPRKWGEAAIEKLTDSIKRFGIIDPLIVNSASGRKNVIIGGHFRYKIAKRLGIKKVPVVYVNIPDIKKRYNQKLWI